MNRLKLSVLRFGLLLPLFYAANVVAAEITIVIKDKKQRSVHDTIVELIGSDSNVANSDTIQIEQLDKEFSPEMSVIPRGSSVLFTNKDTFQHHVYSVSAGNQFDLPLYKDKPAKTINFNEPGIVKLGCNIHDWMLAFAYVNQSQYLLITDATGKAHFTDLTEGEYHK
jgi:plastocyanin